MATAVLPLGQNLSRISNPNKKTKCRLTVPKMSVSLGARVQDFSGTSCFQWQATITHNEVDLSPHPARH